MGLNRDTQVMLNIIGAHTLINSQLTTIVDNNKNNSLLIRFCLFVFVFLKINRIIKF